MPLLWGEPGGRGKWIRRYRVSQGDGENGLGGIQKR